MNNRGTWESVTSQTVECIHPGPERQSRVRPHRIHPVRFLLHSLGVYEEDYGGGCLPVFTALGTSIEGYIEGGIDAIR